jgi:hypothetical protein
MEGRLMLRGLGLALFAASLSPLADAQTAEPLPAGWERPARADLGEWDARLQHKYRYVRAEGDFNGDDKWDRAEMLVNRKEQTFALFVFLAGQSEPIKLDDGKINEIRSLGITTGKPGHKLTVCGKGYRCEKGEAKSVDLPNSSIDYFTFESASSEFYWTGEKFERFWTSD